MIYTINANKEIICIPSGEIINNNTGFFPVKIINNYIQMTDEKLYSIYQVNGKISVVTLLTTENNIYSIQQMCRDNIIVIANELFYCEIDHHFYPSHIIKWLDLSVDKLYSLNNIILARIRYCSSKKYLFFIDDAKNLMFRKNKRLVCLNRNVCSKYICVYGGCFDYDNFAVVLYDDYIMCIQIYSDENNSGNYKLKQEEFFLLDFYINKVYDDEYIDDLGNVYKCNLHKLLCYNGRNAVRISCDTTITTCKVEFDRPIKEILCSEHIHYYLSYDSILFDKINNTVAINVVGSHVPVTNNKSAKNY
jgi:hypothetical protein